jgi:hypothetical protein
MIGKYQRRSLRITGIHEFNSDQFLRRLHKSSISLDLMIMTDARTEIALSVWDRSIFRENDAENKLTILKKLLDGCSFEDSIIPIVDNNKALIHVVGLPVVREKQIEEIVKKLIDLEMKSCIIVNLTPVYGIGMDCPFRVSFSVAISGSNIEETSINLTTIITLIQSIYDNNSTYVILDRRPRRNVRKLLRGSMIHSTLMDVTHAAAYFQLPVTYGIEQIKKWDFGVPNEQPNEQEEGIVIGESVETNIPALKKTKLIIKNLFSHAAIWGASGTGKTTFLKNLLIKLEGTKIKWCVIDWTNEYRSMVPLLKGKLGEDILILNPRLGSLSINPLEIPQTDTPKEILVWERIENFISLFKNMFILGEVQEAKLRESLSSLYANSNSPTLKEAVMTMEVRKMKSLTMKLEKFTQGFYGSIFNRMHSSISFSELRRKNVIIELGQLPSEVRMFFASVFLILWWDNLKLKDPTPNMLVLDDFYRYANVEVIRKMLSEARKFKQGLICSHQGPYQLPQGIREEVVRNTSTKIIFKQEQTWDKRIVRDALGGLTKEHLILLSYLDIGQAIVKLPSKQIPERMNAPKPPKNYMLLDHVIQNAMKKYMGETEPHEAPKVEEPFEKKFLEEIHKNSQLPLTKIIKNLGIKTKRGYELKDKLVVDGYLQEEKIKKGIGRPRVSLKLTDSGLEFISYDGIKTPPQYGKDEHIFMINKIVPLLKDWKVKVEEGCDIKAEKNGQNVAIEIETRKANHKNQVLYNIKRDSAWADKIVLVCPNKTDKSDIENVIKDETDKAIVITYREIDKINEILEH